MRSIGTCTACGETKEYSEFVVEDGRRTKVCLQCGVDETNIEDTVAIADDEIEFIEEHENPDGIEEVEE